MSREELKNLTPEQANAKIKELNEQIKNEKDPKKLNAMNNDLKDLHNVMELRAITEYIDEFKKEKEELLKIPKENILFIDDTPANIETAKQMGWNVCLATGLEFDKIKKSVYNFLEIEGDKI